MSDKRPRISCNTCGVVTPAPSSSEERFVGVPLSLLERLATSEGFFDVEYGFCVFCDITDSHDSSCPWVEARKLIEEAKGG
jgi:hypothetical protein